MQTSIRTQSYSVAHPLHSGWQNELGTGCTVLDPPRQRQDWQVCRQPPDSRRQGKERPRGSEQDEYSPKRRSCYSLMYYAVAKNIFCLVIITMLVFFYYKYYYLVDCLTWQHGLRRVDDGEQEEGEGEEAASGHGGGEGGGGGRNEKLQSQLSSLFPPPPLLISHLNTCL